MATYDDMGYSAAQVAALRANDEARARQTKFSGQDFFKGPSLPGGGSLFQQQGPTGIAGIGAAACKLLAEPARSICVAGAGLLPGGGTTRPGGGSTELTPCRPGTVKVGDRCVAPGDIFPGGDPFITRAGGVPVSGAFGIPGYSPLLVQQPVRRCPAGFALAKDGVCYVRSLIPRKFRAHPPSKRPPLTGADASALRRIGSLQKRVQGLAKIAGLRPMTVAKKATRKRK